MEKSYNDVMIIDKGELVATLMNVGVIIDQSLSQHKLNSGNTYITYKRTINEFCRHVFNGITYNQLTPQMISVINGSHALSYATYLAEKGNKNVTIVHKISIIKQLAVWLKRARFDIDPTMIELPAKLKCDNDNGSEAFSEKEIINMIEKSKEYDNGKKKSLLIRLAFDTAFRKAALLSLKRENFIRKDGKAYVWVYDKGRKKDTKPMNEEVFDLVMDMLGRYPKAPLFTMVPRTVDRTIKKLITDLKIKGNKSFHGIKKASVNMMARKSNNSVAFMQRQGNHSSASTTLNYYHKPENMDAMMYEMVQNYETSDLKLFKAASKEELIRAIDKSSMGTQLEIQALLRKKTKENIK